MESIITIKFKKIMGKEVNTELLKENPALFDTTKITLSKLCQTIEKYLQDYKIKTKIKYELLEDE